MDLLLVPDFVTLLRLMHRPPSARPECDGMVMLVLHYVACKVVVRDEGGRRFSVRPSELWSESYATAMKTMALDTNDPAMTRALVAALALALGRDPGPGGLNVRWARLTASTPDRSGWVLTSDQEVAFVGTAMMVPERHEIGAPEVAAEVDPVAALLKAVRFVIGRAS